MRCTISRINACVGPSVVLIDAINSSVSSPSPPGSSSPYGSAPEHSGNLRQFLQSDIFFTAFNGAQILRIRIRLLSQLLLRQSRVFAYPADVSADDRENS